MLVESPFETNRVHNLAALRSYRWGTFQAWVSLLGATLVIVAAYNYSPWRKLVSYVSALILSVVWYGLLHKRTYGLVLFYLWTLVACGRLAWAMGEALARRHIGLIQLFRIPFFLYAMLSLVGWWIIPAVLYYPKRWNEFS